MLYHYTVGILLELILRKGFIKLATEQIDHGEKPAVWFTSSPKWEHTANKMINDNGILKALNMVQTSNRGGGLARICVNQSSAPHNWEQYKELSGVSKHTARKLRKSAQKFGSKVSEWNVSFKPVERTEWLGIQLYDWKAGWQTLDRQFWDNFKVERAEAEQTGNHLAELRVNGRTGEITVSEPKVRWIIPKAAGDFRGCDKLATG